MPSLKTIRKRITSVKATQKITRAMKMVAGARLNRAQQRIVQLRPYAEKVNEVLTGVSAAMKAAQVDQEYSSSDSEKPTHPLLQRRPERTAMFLVLSGDRGLCGAFNTNVNKAAERAWREKRDAGVEVVFATIGKKGREYLGRRKAEIAKDFPRLYDGLDISSAQLVADFIVGKFEKGEVDSVYIVYNQFKSAITQEITVAPLLPLPEPPETKEGDLGPTTYIYEPHERAVLERLVPMYVEISIFRALLDSQASEHGARMTAMDAATRNAKDMISRLTLVYNRARQAAITKELMEIIGGAEALKD
ncbi:MAG: ATP synthase F1 subunit gamma [Myxococcales bacterium]|nr:ATP synthase F1 subunit gamma [Myxococcales bacterium]